MVRRLAQTITPTQESELLAAQLTDLLEQRDAAQACLDEVCHRVELLRHRLSEAEYDAVIARHEDAADIRVLTFTD